jgi:hypothetical protein
MFTQSRILNGLILVILMFSLTVAMPSEKATADPGSELTGHGALIYRDTILMAIGFDDVGGYFIIFGADPFQACNDPNYVYSPFDVKAVVTPNITYASNAKVTAKDVSTYLYKGDLIGPLWGCEDFLSEKTLVAIGKSDFNYTDGLWLFDWRDPSVWPNVSYGFTAHGTLTFNTGEVTNFNAEYRGVWKAEDQVMKYQGHLNFK